MLQLLAGGFAQAEQFIDQQGLRVHYNAMPSVGLSAEVARHYGIRRSSARSIVVITPQDADNDFAPLTASVTGRARNLVGQGKTLEFRQVREAQAIYYIAEISYAHMETLRFEIDVEVEGRAAPVTVRFQQQFYRDE